MLPKYGICSGPAKNVCADLWHCNCFFTKDFGMAVYLTYNKSLVSFLLAAQVSGEKSV